MYLLYNCFLLLFLNAVPQSDTGIITLVFHNMPINKRIQLSDGSTVGGNGKYELIYYDNHQIPHYINPKYGAKNDTVKIYTAIDNLEVEHVYNGIDKLSYLFKKNDVVDFTYSGNSPVVSIKNRKAGYFELNYDIYLRNRIYRNNFPSIYLYKDPHLSSNIKWSQVKPQDLNEKIKAELKSENLLLDSLKNAQLISRSIYDHYKKKNEFELKSFLLMSQEDKNFHKAEDNFKLNEGLIDFAYYRRYLHTYVSMKYAKNAGMIRTKNGVSRNYKNLYNLIQENTYLPFAEKKYLLRDCVEKIFENSSIKDAWLFFEKFKATFKDAISNDYIFKKYEITNETNELLLIDKNDNSYKLSEILKANKGKLVYVDFWASWCAPCLKTLPISLRINENFQFKNVLFIYISLDEDASAWQNATKKYQLSANSYRVQNKYSSEFLDRLSINSIPRFLLFDKEGKLLYKNAPEPSESELVPILNHFLVR